MVVDGFRFLFFWLDKLSNEGIYQIRIKIVSRPLFAFENITLFIFSGILCLESYIDCSQNWYKNLLMSTRENLPFLNFFWSWIIFWQTIYMFFGLIYVERKWVGFVKHLRRNSRIFFFIILICNSSLSFYLSFYYLWTYKNILVGSIDD